MSTPRPRAGRSPHHPASSRPHHPVVSRNIEVKARVSDLPRLRVAVASLASASPQVVVQTDTFFVVPRGRLKLRVSDGSGELIFYDRPDHAGPKTSVYVRRACPEPKAILEVLGQALGVRGVVEKRREVYMVARSRLHLDEVRGLGTFLEIEVVLGDGEAAAHGEGEARALLAALAVPASALVGRAYIDLLEEP